MAEFRAGLGYRKLPLDSRLGRIACCLPGHDFPLDDGWGSQPAIQTLAIEACSLQLRHVPPAGVLGGITKVQLPHEPPGLGRRKRLIEGRGPMTELYTKVRNEIDRRIHAGERG